MIHCLHGAVGSHHAWDLFCGKLGEAINPVDLWRLFDHDNPTLAQAGRAISAAAAPGDLLLGYSMGGRLALHALLAAPQKWKAAIIVSAHPGLVEGREERRQKDHAWAELSKKDWASFLRQWNQQGILSALPEGLRQAGLPDQNSVSQSFLHWSLGVQKNLRPDLAQITCPLLWITGARDPKFTNLAEEATDLLPNAEHLVLTNAGHRLPWDHPVEFEAAVQDFLGRIPPP